MLLNLIGSTQSFVVLLLSFIIGRLLDANYARYLIAIGAVLVTLGHFLLSIVNGDGIIRDSGSYGATWVSPLSKKVVAFGNMIIGNLQKRLC